MAALAALGGGGAIAAVAPAALASVPTANVGAWTTGASLPTGVSDATVIRLGNGKVLVAGGRTGGPTSTTFTNAAEIYDPSTNSWSSTGAMPIAVGAATAQLLPNGNVLVAGGETTVSGSVQATGDAEIYNASAGTWSQTGALPSSLAVSHASSALLANGTVLVAGGETSSGATENAAEIYSPSSGTFTATGALPGSGVARAASTLLSNGNVLLAGGLTYPAGGSAALSSAAEIYQTSSGTWSAAASLPTAIDGATATSLGANVLIAGGSTSTTGTPTASAELYNIGNNTWSGTGSLPGGGSYDATATLLTDGNVLYAGGMTGSSGSVTNAASIYSPSSGSWSSTGTLVTAVSNAAATTIADGYVLLVGGATSTSAATNAVQLFNSGVPATITSAATATFTEGVAGTFAVTVTGAPTATITESGPLPSGVTFTDNKNNSATIAGTPSPSSVGSYTFSITATDGIGSAATQTFVLTVGQRHTIGYWYVTSAGTVQHQGAAPLDPTSSKIMPSNVVAMAATPDAGGYYLVSSHGNVYNYGDAKFYGSKAHARLYSPIVAISPTSDGAGYYLVTARGNVFNYGDAKFFGSPVHVKLPAAIVGMAVTPDGGGYWLAAASGAVYAFGDAHSYNTVTVNTKVRPVVAIASSVDGAGYYLVTSKGNIYNEGDARFFGSLAGYRHLPAPVAAFGVTPGGLGYYLVTTHGNVYNKGVAPFFGSSAHTKLAGPVTGFATFLSNS